MSPLNLRPTVSTPIRKLNEDAYLRANPPPTPVAPATPPPPTPQPSVSKHVLREQLKNVTAELKALRAARDEMTTPTHLRCPITLQRMVSPVSVSDGHSFERSAIAAWLAERRTNPLTGAPLHDAALVPNLALRDAVLAWETTHGRTPTARAEQSSPLPPPADVEQSGPAAARPTTFLSRALAGAGSWLTSGAQTLAEAERAREERASEREAARVAAEEERQLTEFHRQLRPLLAAAERQREEAERQAEREREAAERQAEREREEAERQAEREREEAERERQEVERQAERELREAERQAERERQAAEDAAEEVARRTRHAEMMASFANVQRVREGLEALSPQSALAWKLDRTTAAINEERGKQGLSPATPGAAKRWEDEKNHLKYVALINGRRVQQGLSPASPSSAVAWSLGEMSTDGEAFAVREVARINDRRSRLGLSPVIEYSDAREWDRAQDSSQHLLEANWARAQQDLSPLSSPSAAENWMRVEEARRRRK